MLPFQRLFLELCSRRSGRWIVAWGAATVLVLGAAGCRRDAEPSPDVASTDAADTASAGDTVDAAEEAEEAGARNRYTLVAHADALALAVQGKQDILAGPTLLQAANLREKAWRRHGKRVDALEALELFTSTAALSWPGACHGALRAALLRAEFEGSPERAYGEVYVVARSEPTHGCRERAEAALAALASHRPKEDELRRILAAAQAETGPAGDGAAADGAGRAPSEHDSHVVVPEVLEQALNTPTTITRVEPYGAEETARVVVHLSHPTRFRVGVLEARGGQEPRLFVDVSQASYEGPQQFEVGGLVRRTRIGQREDGTRVVLDLARPVYHRVFYLPQPFRLVIDVSRDPPERLAARRAIQRIVLDPGHGGSDPGALGPNGLREKDVTLDVAHRAAPLLAREVGVSTLLTRDTDVFVPLDERAARANAFNADLFVSIHCNASEDADQRGVMTFVLDASKDRLAARIAARENASTEAAAAELANALSRVNDAERLQASEHFAMLLQRAAGASLGLKYDQVRDHGVRRAGFYVLAGARMPSVLFESSFISNHEEARRLNQGDYRQRLADSIVNAVRAYQEGR
jgi:N-acetylmuramoyl-L-alanine amidase